MAEVLRQAPRSEKSWGSFKTVGHDRDEGLYPSRHKLFWSRLGALLVILILAFPVAVIARLLIGFLLGIFGLPYLSPTLCWVIEGAVFLGFLGHGLYMWVEGMREEARTRRELEHRREVSAQAERRHTEWDIATAERRQEKEEGPSPKR